MKKIFIGGAAAALAITGLAACNSEPTWKSEMQDSMREEFDAMSDSEVAQGCAAMSLFGIGSGADMLALAEEFGGEADFSDLGIDALPAGVELAEVYDAAWEVIAGECDL